jgi:hypothetical protein
MYGRLYRAGNDHFEVDPFIFYEMRRGFARASLDNRLVTGEVTRMLHHEEFSPHKKFPLSFRLITEISCYLDPLLAHCSDASCTSNLMFIFDDTGG